MSFEVPFADPLATRYGAYVCLRLDPSALHVAQHAAVPALVDRLKLHNEFAGHGDDAPQTIAFLRRIDVASADLADELLACADAVVHVAASTPELVAAFCSALHEQLGPGVSFAVRGGVVRPLYFTSRAMSQFAYANRVLQQPGDELPHAFIVPMRKTAAWWSKGWMERHTYFLPRFDDAGHMRSQGHALAAEAGIACLMRRTYKHPSEPAPDGEYDFVSYFECAEAAVPTFHAVCAALRDTTRNPEWAFVEEGPTWHGRRVPTWGQLFD
jgi:hypothetical protein